MKRALTDLPDSQLAEKRVLMRVDFNVPLSPEGTVTSDHRIRETLPTLHYLLQRGARIILMSHLGRPKGAPDPQFSLKPVALALQALLPQTPVRFVPTVIGPEAKSAVEALAPGEILLLENIRFEPGETKNDPELAKTLAQYADIYVNDAFGAAHRAHASTEGVAHLVPTKVAGLLMQQELTQLGQLLQAPQQPFVAIIGGSKVSSKIGVLNQLMNHVSHLVIGGGMVFTFLKAQGLPVGSSLVEDEFVQTARDLMTKAQAEGKTIWLPTDIEIADAFSADANHKTVPANAIPDGWMGLDIGPDSAQSLSQLLAQAKTVLWNGPLGVFEFPAFAMGTRTVADTLVQLTASGQVVSVLGGGDTQAAIGAFGMDKSAFTHVSTGGGASLELLEGKTLPGVAILEDKTPASCA